MFENDCAKTYFRVILFSVFAILEFRPHISSVFMAVIFSLGSPSFLCVLGSRILVNLKEVGERGLEEGTDYTLDLRSISGIDFANGAVKSVQGGATFVGH